jgi:6-phosphofructokinase 1
LPDEKLKGIPRDEHDHISIAHVNLGKVFARMVSDEYKRLSGQERKVTGLQLGYESRCAQPHAFDVLLGSQLGVGAFRALAEEHRNGVMVSTAGQLDLSYVKFEDLIDQETLVTKVRYIKPGSDFHRLARFLETYLKE